MAKALHIISFDSAIAFSRVMGWGKAIVWESEVSGSSSKELEMPVGFYKELPRCCIDNMVCCSSPKGEGSYLHLPKGLVLGAQLLHEVTV